MGASAGNPIALRLSQEALCKLNLGSVTSIDWAGRDPWAFGCGSSQDPRAHPPDLLALGRTANALHRPDDHVGGNSHPNGGQVAAATQKRRGSLGCAGLPSPIEAPALEGSGIGMAPRAPPSDPPPIAYPRRANSSARRISGSSTPLCAYSLSVTGFTAHEVERIRLRLPRRSHAA